MKNSDNIIDNNNNEPIINIDDLVKNYDNYDKYNKQNKADEPIKVRFVDKNGEKIVNLIYMRKTSYIDEKSHKINITYQGYVNTDNGLPCGPGKQIIEGDELLGEPNSIYYCENWQDGKKNGKGSFSLEIKENKEEKQDKEIKEIYSNCIWNDDELRFVAPKKFAWFFRAALVSLFLISNTPLYAILLEIHGSCQKPSMPS